MIEHIAQVGRTSAALELLSGKTYTVSVKEDRVSVSHQSGPNAEGHEFQSEEAYMVWMLHQIIEAAQTEIEWFNTHPR